MKVGAGDYHFLDGATLPGRGNITQHVTELLREGIVSLDFAPGELLNKGLICKRLGVSRFPVSEALTRLAVEGLVEIQPQRGTLVTEIRLTDVLEFMLIRKALEAEAVRVVSSQRRPEVLEALEVNLARQAQFVAADDPRGFHRADLDFHDLIFGAVGFSRIKATIDATRSNLDRARRLILTPRRLGISLGEHRRIANAIVAGDAPAAMAAMRTHIDGVMAELIAFARANADDFADCRELRGDPNYPSFPYG